MNAIELINSIQSFDFIDNINVKSMFGGKRIFANGVPFCQFYDGKLYFRASAVNVPQLTAQGFEQLVTYKNQSPVKHNYFVVPNAEVNDHEQLYLRLASSLDEALKEKSDTKINQRIKDLPNLRVQVERSLSKVGITSVSELRKQGPIEAFVKLKQDNANVSLELLYSLSAALKGIHKSVLSSQDKHLLRVSLEMEA